MNHRAGIMEMIECWTCGELTEHGIREAEDFGTCTVEDNPRTRCDTISILFDWTFDGPVNRIT